MASLELKIFGLQEEFIKINFALELLYDNR